jgi:protoporphyrinogen IX oxidase
LKWLLALHVISMVCWFAGLFYLPRLFVYHTNAKDSISIERFKIMERRLYYCITTPAALLTTFFGLWLLSLDYSYYATLNWMHLKLLLVAILWAYHIACGYYTYQFKQDNNRKHEKFFRFFNEIPTILLIAIVILVIVQPYLGPDVFEMLHL